MNSKGEEVESGGRRKWLAATVLDYNATTGMHKMEYVLDGEIEDLDLLTAERDWVMDC